MRESHVVVFTCERERKRERFKKGKERLSCGKCQMFWPKTLFCIVLLCTQIVNMLLLFLMLCFNVTVGWSLLAKKMSRKWTLFLSRPRLYFFRSLLFCWWSWSLEGFRGRSFVFHWYFCWLKVLAFSPSVFVSGFHEKKQLCLS